jgi:3D (Asp-Asp-Asp) domain-containing protein
MGKRLAKLLSCLAFVVRLLTPLPLVAAPTTLDPINGGRLRVSLYYVADEPDYPSRGGDAFRDASGHPLYHASPAFVAAATIEGAARTAAGRLLVFDPETPGQGWAWSAARFGVDALDCPLIPYRTAAVPRWIPLGARLYIPETVGLPLPDGGRHDGYWYATDRGVGIDGDRIDLFMSVGKASMRAGERFGLEYLKPVHARVVGRLQGCARG